MKNKILDAVVAGLTCLDITPIFKNLETKNINEVFIPSKTILIGQADINSGGCVSNTGLAMNKFRINTRLIGKVGNDEFGKIILKQFEEYTTTESMINTDEGTAYSVVLAPVGIDRMFLHYSGGNDTFSPNDIDYDLVGRSKLFHFGYPQAMRNLYINDGAGLIEIYSRVKELDVTTSMDTCGIDANSTSASVDWKKVIRDVIQNVDIFAPSAEELCYMIDKPRFLQWEERAGDQDLASVLSEEDLKPLADVLISWGAKVIMIKCGSSGIYLATNEKKILEGVGSDLRPLISEWDNVRHFERSFKPSKVLSGTGAGDTCIAAFLSAIIKGYSWERCLEYAAATGALCVETYDSLSGLISFNEIDDRIKAGWERNE